MEQTKMEQTKNVVLTLNIKDDTSSDIELPKLKTDPNQKNRIEQSFRLQGVNIVDIMTKIIDGDLPDLNLPDKKYSHNSTKIALSRTYGSYPHDTFYEIKIGGRKDKIVTLISNCNDGDKFCDWCRRDFNWDAIGIPVCMITNDEEDVITFNVVGEHCTFECMYADASAYILKTPKMTSGIYFDSDTLINIMYNLYRNHGNEHDGKDKKLNQAPYWKLYNGGRGPLKEEEFFSNSHQYIPNGSINVHSVRPEYQVKDQ